MNRRPTALRAGRRIPFGYGHRIAAPTDADHVRKPASVLVGVLLGAVAMACTGGDDEPELLINLTDEAIGTCLDFGDSVEAEVAELPTVPCDEPHTHEIYAIAFSDEPTYPGLEALESDAQEKCLGEFEGYVGVSAFDSELFFSWLVPTLDSWDSQDDRQIVCVIGEDNGAPLVGTVRDIGR